MVHVLDPDTKCSPGTETPKLLDGFLNLETGTEGKLRFALSSVTMKTYRKNRNPEPSTISYLNPLLFSSRANHGE